MNLILLYCASGESLYPGAALLVVTVALSAYLRYSWLVRVRNVGAWLAMVLIVMSCPPFSWSFDAIFVAAFLYWFIAWNTDSVRLWTRARIISMVLLVALSLALPAVEFPHRLMPVIAGEPSDRLVVIGDSISSGLGNHVQSWPIVMQKMIGVEVKNLSKPGAMVSDGVAMSEKVTPEDRLILIELGGNDLIAGVPPDTFARGLEAVFGRLAVPGRTLVMFELPLLPHTLAYGQFQRRLAAKYRVHLIPKRYLAQVISGRDATSDGLHLTDVGSRRMATVVVEVLSPLLKSGPDATTPARHP